jgi:hypothetical protein
MLDEVKKARESGVTAREYAKSKGIPSTLSDEEAAILDKYGVKMLDDGAGNGTPGAAGERVGKQKVRVGQWMTEAEYERFVKTGEIPRTNVLTKGMDGYIKQANKGDFYVEFDINSSILVPKNEELGWSLIKSKNQMYHKLYEKKGLNLPPAVGTNIKHVNTK